eukprot:c22201_g1_i1.p1 GENE.c22201_g1_i1~~c22201_g1_i1.p1  ORF type:complete len:189 (+),score=77.59 c22201_g1_i1:3-569(+)
MGEKKKNMENDDVLIPSIEGVLLLDANGKRIAAKYYSQNFSQLQAQQTFETSFVQKFKKLSFQTEAEIMTMEKQTVVYQNLNDVQLVVIASSSENELLVLDVLSTLSESITKLLRVPVNKISVFENLDLINIALDELCDGGLILENDSTELATKVTMNSSQSAPSLTEQSLTEAAWSLRGKLAKSLLG